MFLLGKGNQDWLKHIKFHFLAFSITGVGFASQMYIVSRWKVLNNLLVLFLCLGLEMGDRPWELLINFLTSCISVFWEQAIALVAERKELG